MRNQLRARIERWHPIVSVFLALWVRNQETASRLTRMEAVVDTSVIPTLMLDCRGRLVYANRAGEAHLKRPGGPSARVLPTGDDPFAIPRDELGRARRAATGAGFYGISPSVTAILPSDPVVLFGTLGYTSTSARMSTRGSRR